mmetsp:Transcript_32614/g.97332  ORF Transcript_32614/g.97332 Transcript_32614/m.97332 type:complete len:249 (+) Transcript_32614:411-1157(+)
MRCEATQTTSTACAAAAASERYAPVRRWRQRRAPRMARTSRQMGTRCQPLPHVPSTRPSLTLCVGAAQPVMHAGGGPPRLGPTPMRSAPHTLRPQLLCQSSLLPRPPPSRTQLARSAAGGRRSRLAATAPSRSATLQATAAPAAPPSMDDPPPRQLRPRRLATATARHRIRERQTCHRSLACSRLGTSHPRLAGGRPVHTAMAPARLVRAAATLPAAMVQAWVATVATAQARAGMVVLVQATTVPAGP